MAKQPEVQRCMAFHAGECSADEGRLHLFYSEIFHAMMKQGTVRIFIFLSMAKNTSDVDN